MWTKKVRVLEDVSPANWLVSRLTGERRATPPSEVDDCIVPRGYQAYARILHPVDFSDGREPATWAHVAELVGDSIGPKVRWHELMGSADPYERTSELWSEGYPEWGNLHVSQLQALCGLLEEQTSTPDDCFFAMWEGWGQLVGGNAYTQLTTGGGETVEPLLTREELQAPRVRVPHRSYLLMGGPLSAMGELVHFQGPQSWVTQSPSLFWPADRAWCVATEIDADSTLVGGPIDAVDAVLAAPALEAVRLQAAIT